MKTALDNSTQKAFSCFELLGFPESYALDLADLQRAYVKAQQGAHPDRMIGKSEDERAKAALASMDANEAYETLKNPLTRAQHLLELQGIIVNADERDTHKPSQALLMEMLELREEMAASSSEGEIAKHAQDIKTAMKQTEADLGALFEKAEREAVAQAVIRLRYYGKALEEAMSIHYRLKSHAS
jgi:molecular chaperone HscB